MKTKILLTACLFVAASASFADGPGEPPYMEPPVIALDAPAAFGFYGGLAFNNTEATSRTTTEWSEERQDSEEVPILDSCQFDGGHSGGKKCTFAPGVAQTLFPDAPDCGGNYAETCFMTDNRVFILGATGDAYVYDTGETETVYGPVYTEYFSETVRNFVEGGKVGGFVGVSYGETLVGRFELGADGELFTAEAHLGYAFGSLMPYAFVGAGQYDQQAGTVYGAGVDLDVGANMMVGAKWTEGSFGGTETQTIGLRVGVRFF